VLRVAFQVARRTLPAYSHRCSPKKFTQHQLFACLVLKEFFKLDYRGVEALLAESDSLRAIIDLKQTPDFTTLHKACRRLLRLPVCNRMLDETIRTARKTLLLRSPVKLSAIDSSGFEAHRVSNYFVRRRAAYGKQTGKWHVTTYRRFPKLAVVCDCSSHLILAAVPHRGPCPDFDHWIKPMKHACSRVRMTTLLADAGYDAEWIHVAARRAFQTRTLIPPNHGRPTKKLPAQYYRRRMKRIFATRRSRKPYRQRAQVETVFSVVKRRLDSSVNAHSYWSQCRALMLKALVHNLMLLKRRQVFDRATITPYPISRQSLRQSIARRHSRR
jgi:hypothetical protein